MPNRATLPSFAIALLASASLWAGVEITASERDLPDGPPSTTKVQIETDRIRIDASSESGPQILIFRGDRQLLWIASPQDQSYYEITEQQIDRLASQISTMNQMQQRMQQRLENMPPEQRARIEEMMKGRMGAMNQTPSERTAYEKVASGEKVQQWSCDKYVGRRQDQKSAEIWTASWNELGLAAEDFQALQQMGRFFEHLSNRVNEPFFQVGSADWETQHGYPGIPVRRIQYLQEHVQRESLVQQISKKNLAPELFEPDPNWTKKSFPMLPGAR